MKTLAILCLIMLSTSFGTAYAVVSKALHYYNATILNSLRMIFAFWSSLVFILVLIIIKPEYFHTFKKSIKKHKTPLLSSMFCGVLNYGFPHSLLTIAQRSIPSSIIVIVQPFVTLFELFFASLLLHDEKFSFSKLFPQLIAITGSTISSLPNFLVVIKGTGDVYLVDYLLLLIALLSFAFGMVYIKAFLKKANNILIGSYQLFGAAVYSTLFAIYNNNFCGYYEAIVSAGSKALIFPFVLGVCFTCSATFLMVYCIKELGAVTTGYSNHLQIVIGVLFGVFFLHEWKDYSKNEIILSVVGLLMLVISVVLGLRSKEGRREK